MTKTDCIEIFNAMLHGTPISFSDKILPLISDYLVDTNTEHADRLLSVISQNPMMAQNCLPTIVKYYTGKYGILSVIYNNKTIFYYE